MARSSGAGTGVIVALVVSVVCNLGLLTITFMMYSGKTEALENEARIKAEMSSFVTNAERTDAFERVMDAAKQERKSLYNLLESRRQGIASFVAGNPNASLTEMQSGLGLDAGDVVRNAIGDLRKQVNASRGEISRLEDRLADAQTNNDELRDRLAEVETSADDRVALVEDQIRDYADAATQYEQDVQEAVATIEESRARLERDHRNSIAEKDKELGEARNQLKLLQEKVQELMRKTESFRIKPQSPAELVDGRIISVPGTGGQVFIDLGSNDRVIPGMTFEVYEGAAAIRPDPRTGEYGRGKASIEIIRVGADTSAARITRELPGRPVVKDDVIANAVFNPEYRFKFLVHGLFDVNNDGVPSAAETDYVRSRVENWGGVLVDSEDIPGDLDFLVLGVEPREPPEPDVDDSQLEVESYRLQMAARALYLKLFGQASQAQIPVLNWNRFETLTGTTDR